MGEYGPKVTLSLETTSGLDRMLLILSGVKISDGAIIGARSVIAKDVAPYSIVVGNPAREIGKRFDDNTIAKLLNIKWWDWDINRIKENRPFCYRIKLKSL